MKIVTKCVFNSARTVIDGGWRITFDLSERDAEFVTKLNNMKHKGLYLVLMPIGEDADDQTTGGTSSQEDGPEIRDADSDAIEVPEFDLPEDT